jgi:lipid-binding SYLF domain-containing protein
MSDSPRFHHRHGKIKPLPPHLLQRQHTRVLEAIEEHEPDHQKLSVLPVSTAPFFGVTMLYQTAKSGSCFIRTPHQLHGGRRALMIYRNFTLALAAMLLVTGLSSAKDSPEQKREKSRKMASQTLEKLYKLQPTAQGAIQKSAGYAVFNNMGTNLLLVSTARGAGIAVNSKTKQETFMKMISAGAGLGIGVKDYCVIFVFENEAALNRFLNSGWEGSAQGDAAAKAGKSGAAYSGAVQVAPGVWVYQMTKNGLALQLTLQGTKYYKDDDLNKK